jgi:exonuclease SbcC
LKTITEAIAESKRLHSQIKEIQHEAVVADSLANHLKATGFERWLVSEALDLLVDGASATLRGLSSGQYSLTRDERNEFLVIDHRNADERRPAKTLSGGETFQASLALALALADQLAGLAAGGAAKLESIFLDEGFGTLDPETLATVADTIEALGNEERMVGIVTHVRELAERVPVRFEVTKTARTSGVERQSV